MPIQKLESKMLDDSATTLFGYRNRILNGDFRVNQRGNTSQFATSSSSGFYFADQWRAPALSGQSTANVKIEISSNVPSGQGFNGSQLLTVITANSSPVSSGTSQDQSLCPTYIEGYSLTDLNYGTANAKTMTLSFWVKSSITGKWGIFMYTPKNSRMQLKSYNINTANTWEYKTITIEADTSSTAATNTDEAMRIEFRTSISPDQCGTETTAWKNLTSERGVTGQTDMYYTSGATWAITGIQLELGSVATPFERRPYATDLAMCQRYYYQAHGHNNAGATYMRDTFYFKQSMRVAPTVTVHAKTTGGSGTGTAGKVYQGTGETNADANYATTETVRIASNGYTSNIDIYYLAKATAEY